MSNDSAIIHFPCNNAYINTISVYVAIARSCMLSQLATAVRSRNASCFWSVIVLTVIRDESWRCTSGPAVCRNN